MPDSSAVDAAVVGRLLGDATLTGLMPDGVYFDVGGKDATRFVLVSQVDEDDIEMQGGDAFERFLYLVKAVEKSTTGANVLAAAARIQTLLNGTTYAVTGYTLARSKRVARVRYTEIDDADPDIRWQHRGGRYEVWVSP